jgi:hypothetical protein
LKVARLVAQLVVWKAAQWVEKKVYWTAELMADSSVDVSAA